MKRLSTFFALFFLYALTTLAQNNIQLVIEGKVVRVSDGDTITVLDKENKQHKIRFQGIDAPESKQAFGEAAKEYLSRMVFNKQVTVEWSKVDKYNRTVGKVLLDGRDINLEQVKAGYAWHYKKYSDEQPPEDRVTYAKAEEEARAARRGLWQDPNPTPPGDFRVEAKEERWGPAPPAGTIIGNKNSMKYHRPDCPGYKDVAERNRVFFKTVAEAESAGYKRAGNCPPETSTTTAATAKPTAQPTTPAPVVSRSEQPASTQQAGEVIGNKNSKKYHLPHCAGYKTVSEQNRVTFKSAAEAETAGYTLAGNCKAEGQTSESRPKQTPEATATETSTQAAPAGAAATTGEVIGNKNSKKYHLMGCPGYNQVGEKNRVYFKTAAEAEAAGYTKAGNCKK